MKEIYPDLSMLKEILHQRLPSRFASDFTVKHKQWISTDRS